jgi:imidazolonepropionase-like amidohydrolase
MKTTARRYGGTAVGRMSGLAAMTAAFLTALPPYRLSAQVPEPAPYTMAVPAAGHLVAITNATIMTASHGTIQRGTIVIRDGRIAEVGENVLVPAGAQIIDGTGRYVIPGIVDAHSHSALEAINEGTKSVTAEVRIADVVRHDALTLYRELAGGVTSANLLHGSANTIGGQNLVIKLRYGLPADSMVFQGAPPGIKFALGENVRQSNVTVIPGQARRYPESRMGVEQVLRDAFTRAQHYKAEWTAYRADSSAWARNRSRTRGADPIPPARDLQLDALVEVLDGKRMVHAHSYRSDEILMLLGVAHDFGFKIQTLQHVLEGYRVADEIAAAGTGASTFADEWAYKLEAYDAIPHNAALMAERGVLVSINSDSDERARRLYQEAAKAMHYGGASEESALRMITLNPAQQLGVGDRTGSIDVGKDADLAIFNGHPFSPASRVEMTLIDGRVFFDRTTAPTLEYRMQQQRPSRPARAASGGGQ